MCIFCNSKWKIKSICSECIKDKYKVDLFHLTSIIPVLYNVSLSEEQINELMNEYEKLKEKKMTQKEIHKILLEKYKKYKWI